MKSTKKWKLLAVLFMAVAMTFTCLPAGAVQINAEETETVTETEEPGETIEEVTEEPSGETVSEQTETTEEETETVTEPQETEETIVEETEEPSEVVPEEPQETVTEETEETEEIPAEEAVPAEEETEKNDVVEEAITPDQEIKKEEEPLLAGEVEVSTYAQLKTAINNAPDGVETRIKIKTGATIKVRHSQDGNINYSHFGNEKPDYIHWDYSVPSGKNIVLYSEGKATIAPDRANGVAWIGISDGASVKVGSGNPDDELSFIMTSFYIEKGGSLEVNDGVNLGTLVGDSPTSNGNYGMYVRGNLDIHGGYVDMVNISPGGVLNSFDGGSMRHLSVAGVVKTIGPDISIINDEGPAITVYNVPTVFAYQSEWSSKVARGTGPAYIEKIAGGTFVGATDAISVSSTSPYSGSLYGGIVEIEDGTFVAENGDVLLLSDSTQSGRWSIKKITNGTFISHEGSVFRGGLGGSTYRYGNANNVVEIVDGTFICKKDVFAGASAGTIRDGYYITTEGSIFAGSHFQAYSGQQADFKCIIDYLEPGITDFRGNARYYCGENDVVKPKAGYNLDAIITKIDEPYVFSGPSTVNESIELPAEYAGSFATTYDFQTLIRPAKVTFDLNGGTSDSSDYADRDVDVTQESTNKVEMPADQETPIRTNYVLTGWVNEETGDEYDIGDSVTITKDTTFVAQYKYQYTISFDPNGGEGEMDDITVTEGEEVELPENKFTREGHTFEGWNTASDGSGDSYDDKATVKDLTEEAGETVTLYAVWKPIEYTITYKLNGGTYNGSPDDILETYDYGTEIDIHEASEKENMVFKYWEGSEYYPGDKYTVVGDHTFVAQYKYKYTITFDPNGGEGTMDDVPAVEDEDTELPKNQFTKKGYTFDGWNTAKDGSGDSYADQDTVNNLGKEAGEVVTLYAVWTPIKYTITYKLNGGTYNGSSEDITETYDYGTEIEIHKAPTKTGMTFQYWEGSLYYPGEKYTVVEDHTFKAVYQAVESEKPTDPKQNQDKPKSSDTAKKKAVNTNDSGLALWMVMFVLSLAGAVGVIRFRTKVQ